MDFETNHRAGIARRNQRRAIESRDYKAMMVMFGILCYSGKRGRRLRFPHVFHRSLNVLGHTLG